MTVKDLLSNLKLCKMSEVELWKGIVVKLCDKFYQIAEFARKGELKAKSEGIRDTFIDMVVYSLLEIILLEEEKSKRKDKIAMQPWFFRATWDTRSPF